MRAPTNTVTWFMAILFTPALAAPSIAQESGIRIGNFGRVDEGYYRGAQPTGSDYADLAALGVKTVIDLTANRDTNAAEPLLVERAGMKAIRIPMSTQSKPRPDDVIRFLALVNDPANRPVFVHCVGGRHRTGAMTATYRMTEHGWNADRAYAEMKQFRFSGFPGHPALKRYVFDYYSRLVQPKGVGTPTAVPSQ